MIIQAARWAKLETRAGGVLTGINAALELSSGEKAMAKHRGLLLWSINSPEAFWNGPLYSQADMEACLAANLQWSQDVTGCLARRVPYPFVVYCP
jgi:hypothetical protein